MTPRIGARPSLTLRRVSVADEFAAGDILIVDWRDTFANEANKRRPAVIVSRAELAGLETVLLVPIAGETSAKVRNAFVTLSPTAENGCTKTSYALAHLVTATSVDRITEMPGTRIEPTQLAELRRQIAFCVDAYQ
jgi:mRNA interferase MazF